MALLTAYSITAFGIDVPSQTPSTQDTIAAADIGDRGALLYVINSSGAPVTLTLVDPYRTPMGSSPVNPATAIPASGRGWFRITPSYIDPAAGVATVQLSAAASVTYRLIRM